jgi:hypothetical protein
MKLALMIVELIISSTAIALVLRTLRWTKAIAEGDTRTLPR